MNPADIIHRLPAWIQITENVDSVVCSGVDGYRVVVKSCDRYYITNFLCNKIGLMMNFTFNIENLDMLTEQVEQWCKGFH